jgi:hypothetical protein
VLTRLEAIKLCAIAKREGKEIPLEVKIAMELTKDQDAFHSSPKPNVRVSEKQVSELKSSTTNKGKKTSQVITPPSSVSRSGAITSAQMAEYEAKRKAAKLAAIEAKANKPATTILVKKKKAKKPLLENKNKEASNEVLEIMGLRRDNSGRIVLIKKNFKQSPVKPQRVTVSKPVINDFSKTGNFKYTGEELRALAAGKPLPPKVPVEVIEVSPVVVPIIPVSDAQETSAKPAIAKPLAVSVEVAPAFFSKEAYQLAIRSMPPSEAWKIAKDKDRSRALLTAVVIPIKEDSTLTPHLLEKPAVAPVVQPMKVLNIVAKGKKVKRSIVGRDIVDQENFKRRVRANFNHRCAVTGQNIGLQAAHIESFADSCDFSTSNGILLDCLAHYMFDNCMLGINPETLKIHFSVDCIYKSLFEGNKIADSKIPLNKKYLENKWNTYIRHSAN